MSIGLIIVILLVLALLFSSIKIISEYERAVVFRFGRALPEAKGPGLSSLFQELIG